MNRMQSAPVWWLIGVVLVASVGCDQFTKHVAQNHLKGQPVASYWGDTFRLQYAENPGAFLGLGQDLPEGVRRTLLIGVNLAIASALATVMVLPVIVLFVAAQRRFVEGVAATGVKG